MSDSLEEYVAGAPLKKTPVAPQAALEETFFLGLRLTRGGSEEVATNSAENRDSCFRGGDFRVRGSGAARREGDDPADAARQIVVERSVRALHFDASTASAGSLVTACCPFTIHCLVVSVRGCGCRDPFLWPDIIRRRAGVCHRMPSSIPAVTLCAETGCVQSIVLGRNASVKSETASWISSSTKNSCN